MPITIDDLLAPIPGPDPAGDKDSFYLVRDELEKSRKEDDLSGWDPNDQMRPKEALKADWGRIIRLGTEALSSKCKHLELAARVTEALTKTEGFAGLTAGLTLLTRLVEDCWPRMFPEIDDGDVTVRDGPFILLGTEEGGIFFPMTVRKIPIVTSKERSFGWYDWRQLSSGKGQPGDKEAYDQALGRASDSDFRAIFDGASAALDAFATLTKALERPDRMGPDAPPMPDLKAAILECRQLADELLKMKNPSAGTTPEAATTTLESSAPSSSTGGGAGSTPNERETANLAVATRDALYRRIEEAAALLEKLEPRSPVPYLVRRAVDLGRKPFPELLQIMINNPDMVAAISREYGVPSPPPPTEE